MLKILHCKNKYYYVQHCSINRNKTFTIRQCYKSFTQQCSLPPLGTVTCGISVWYLLDQLSCSGSMDCKKEWSTFPVQKVKSPQVQSPLLVSCSMMRSSIHLYVTQSQNIVLSISLLRLDCLLIYSVQLKKFVFFQLISTRFFSLRISTLNVILLYCRRACLYLR